MLKYGRADFYCYDTKEGLVINGVKVDEDAFNVLLCDLAINMTKECRERIQQGRKIIDEYEKDMVF
ncbi:MAG: hypothetical protein ACLTDM_11260 [Clostridium butyricum]